MPESSYSEAGDGDGWPPDAYKRPQGLLLRLALTLTDALEAESDRWILWLPVFFAGGIALYFALPTEPQARLAVPFVLGALGIFLFVRGSHAGIALAVTFLALSLGFGAAKLRTELVRAPVLQDELRHVSVQRYVETFERRSGARDRLTLRVLSIGSLTPAATPKRVRVSISGKKTTVFPREAVSLRATLNPPPEPVAPGGFDFGRRAWFQQLGGIGYATGRIEHLDGAPEPPWGLRLWAGIEPASPCGRRARTRRAAR